LVEECCEILKRDSNYEGDFRRGQACPGEPHTIKEGTFKFLKTERAKKNRRKGNGWGGQADEVGRRGHK